MQAISKNRLTSFGKQIIKLCKQINITPILYGSLAYRLYTADTTCKVNDIDFYIKESDLFKVSKLLKKHKIKHRYSKKWHTVVINKDRLIIDLDSLEYWYKGKHYFKKLNFLNQNIKILTKNSLGLIYKHAAKVNNKPKQYLKKYLKLKPGITSREHNIKNKIRKKELI